MKVLIKYDIVFAIDLKEPEEGETIYARAVKIGDEIKSFFTENDKYDIKHISFERNGKIEF